MISVIIPAYNCAEFLPEAINSVLAQSLKDFEVIVVDDGSTDATPQVMERYGSDARIRYLRQENRGLPGARNRGVREAAGEFILALDADDLLAPTALIQMKRALDQSGASWCIMDVLKFWDGCEEVRRTEVPTGDLLIGILKNDFICCGMFFRKEALERVGLWDEEMRAREDWDLHIRLITANEQFAYLPEALYHYRRRPGSITTGNKRKILTYTDKLLRKHHRELARSGASVYEKIYAANLWLLSRRYLYELHAPVDSLRCASESLRNDFDWERIMHPLLHLVRRAYRQKRRTTA